MFIYLFVIRSKFVFLYNFANNNQKYILKMRIYDLLPFGYQYLRWELDQHEKSKKKYEQHKRVNKIRDTNLKLIGISSITVPQIPISAVLFLASGVSISGVQNSGALLKNTQKPLFWIGSLFKKSQYKQISQLKEQNLLSKKEIQEFNQMVKKEISKDSSTIYVVVKSLEFKKSKILNVLVIALKKEDTVQTVMMLCKARWNLTQIQSYYLLSNKVIVMLNTALINLLKNDLGVIELDLLKMETMG